MAFDRWCRRRRRQERPIDLGELHALVRQFHDVSAKYEHLLPAQENLAMTTPNPAQSNIDADVAQLTTDLTTLVNVQAQIATLVSNAQAAGQPVDTSALDALVSQADSTVTSYQNLITPPAPPAGP